MALSATMVAILTLLASRCSLTDQLRVEVYAAVPFMNKLRAELLASIDDAVELTMGVGRRGDVYLQRILNGAAGYALAGPSAFSTSAVTPASIAALISGKVATVVQDSTVAVGATGGYIASGAVTTAGAIAQVDLNNT